METIGERLIHLRHSKNLTRAEVREHFGFAESTYRNYENDGRVPSNKVLYNFAQFYQCDFDWLVGVAYLKNEMDFILDVLEQNVKYGDSNGLRSRHAIEYIENQRKGLNN